MSVNLGDFIRERRQDLGLTQEQLAERVGEGMRQAEISRLEHNRIILPRRSRLEQLAAALEVSIGDLLVQTGWLNDEHVPSLQIGNGVIHRDQAVPAALDAVAMENLLVAVEQITALRTMVEHTAAILDEAEQTITTAIRAVNNSRGMIHTSAGIMDRWESSAVFT